MERRFHRGFTAAEKTEPKHVSLPAAAAALPSASDSGAAAAIDTNAVVTAPASRSALRVGFADIQFFPILWRTALGAPSLIRVIGEHVTSSVITTR